ncbi:MAG: adenosylmethionine--8-amino-7-oxononanoate transaminase, partial [Alphaproteobacteria bacterium]|nr:adenosylmethionine--8-amino-7-oxononanoate transaminase [Alphaproteobacteria bacterium]
MSKPSSSRVWHPFTQHALQPTVPEVVSADGAWLTLRDGSKLFDGISSWWVATHGHRHPKIIDAIKSHADQLDQVIFAGLTHAPAEQLSARLVDITPDGLDWVFYSDSGSTAVEVAVKMALGYWHNQDRPRHRIVCLEHGYHGDTIGAMSAGARGIFNAAYEPLLFDVTHLPFPAPGEDHKTIAAFEAACTSDDVAALLVEPLILGSGGMKLYSAETLRALKGVCEKNSVLFIADEVMTGWGRTGTRFACEQAGIVPDILCLAKGLTGGSVPLAATLSTDAIFQAHVSPDRRKTFFHSSSFTANPICCAAAVANLEVWDTEPVAERIETLHLMQQERLAGLQGHPRLANLRQLGTITAMEFETATSSYLAELGPKLYQHFVAQGILLRPLGNT